MNNWNLDAPEWYSNVSRAEYDFDEPEFDEITETAKDFISSLLVKDAKNRLTSERAIEYVIFTLFK